MKSHYYDWLQGRGESADEMTLLKENEGLRHHQTVEKNPWPGSGLTKIYPNSNFQRHPTKDDSRTEGQAKSWDAQTCFLEETAVFGRPWRPILAASEESLQLLRSVVALVSVWLGRGLQRTIITKWSQGYRSYAMWCLSSIGSYQF